MQEKVLMKGNEAIAEAAILAGCRHYLGYPITPQTEVAAYMAKKMPKIGGTFLQAESEIAAINMVYGVAATGKRAMTSSSSPGIALKCEGISYLAGADLPAVIVNVQRGGPGLGGIQPSQSDYFLATRGPGHGDFHVLVLAPASVQEMADLTEPVSIDDLAARFFVSKYHMMRQFRAQTGYTIHGYLTGKRLMRARAMIAAGTPVLQASEESGFGDYSAFLRAYRKQFGTTPNQEKRAN